MIGYGDVCDLFFIFILTVTLTVGECGQKTEGRENHEDCKQC